MIYINRKKLNTILELKLEDILMTFDFDRTMTSANSTTSWGVVEKSHLIPDDYRLDSLKLYNYYRLIEINEEIDKKYRDDMMIKWTMEQINLFYKYNIDSYIFNKIMNEHHHLYFRDGLISFLESLSNEKVPISIISAGLGNVVVNVLEKNNLLKENVFVISNILKYVDNKVNIIGPIINSTNKSYVTLPSKLEELKSNKKILLLFGDQISDILIGNNFKNMPSLNIGFLNGEVEHYLELYKKYFDIVCTSDEGYTNIEKILVKKDLKINKEFYD